MHAPVSHSSSSQLASIGVTSTVSTTPPNVKKRSRNPKRWSINDVVDYVREKEPALHNHLYIFQKHVSNIDLKVRIVGKKRGIPG